MPEDNSQDAQPEGVIIKKPRAPYFMFMAERRAAFKEENPELKNMFQVSKAMAAIWREMGEEERQHFEQAAVDDKARYQREVEEAGGIENVVFKKSSPFKRMRKDADGNEIVKAPKEPKWASAGGTTAGSTTEKGVAPKRGLSAYIFFCGDQRKDLKESQPSLSMTDMTKIMSEQWKNADAETKAKYQSMADNDKQRYERQKKEYEETGKFTVE